MHCEMEKNVPRSVERKVEYLPSDNSCKNASKSDTISTKGQNRITILDKQRYNQKGLSPIPQKSNFSLPFQNNRRDIWPTETLTYSQPYFHKDKDNLTENLRLYIKILRQANILLDPSFEAKVADFGLAKFFPDGISKIVATNLMGTFGYLAPELSMGELREKSDIFAFGVVLLELITGKKPIIIRPVFSEESNPFVTLVDWAKPLVAEALQNGRYDSLVDSRLCNIYNHDEMKRMIACAAACVQRLPQDRPLMSKVALVLAGQTSTDDLCVAIRSTEIHTASISSTEIHTASISSMEFEESR